VQLYGCAKFFEKKFFSGNNDVLREAVVRISQGVAPGYNFSIGGKHRLL